MSLFSRFNGVIRRQGFKMTVTKTLGVAADYWFDWRYGMDTIAVSRLDNYTIEAESRAHGTSYEGIRVLPARSFIRHVRTLVQGGVFVDLGCGKGKAVLIAVQAGIAKARGIEFARELCDVARRNWASFQPKAGCQPDACEIIEGDVTTYDYPGDETIYFINNPFDEIILAKVIANITTSAARDPRRVLIVICNLSAHFRAVMDQQKVFSLVQVPTFWGYPFSIYSNRER
jgi:SAM-dependent methyltransferase